MSREYRCQFCGESSPAKEWKDDTCPKCSEKYDPVSLQDYDDEP